MASAPSDPQPDAAPMPFPSSFDIAPSIEDGAEEPARSPVPAAGRLRHIFSSTRHERHPKLEPEKLRSIYDYPEGVPQLAAFMSSDQDFLVCRSFTTLRARLLLVEEIKLAMLEDELEHLENKGQEAMGTQGNLRTLRHYYDEERKEILDAIKKSLRDYDKILMSLSMVKKFPKVRRGNMTSFLNFLGNSQPLARYDMVFARDEMDFIAVSPGDDYTVIERLIERLMSMTGLGKCEFFAGKRSKARTRIPDGQPGAHMTAQIYSPTIIQKLAKGLGTLIAVGVLVLPIVVLNELAAHPSRNVYYMIPFIGAFAIAVLALTQAKKHEIFGATAAYAAVLVVFIGVDRK